jgi:hypothetical protein
MTTRKKRTLSNPSLAALSQLSLIPGGILGALELHKKIKRHTKSQPKRNGIFDAAAVTSARQVEKLERVKDRDRGERGTIVKTFPDGWVKIKLDDGGYRLSSPDVIERINPGGKKIIVLSRKAQGLANKLIDLTVALQKPSANQTALRAQRKTLQAEYDAVRDQWLEASEIKRNGGYVDGNGVFRPIRGTEGADSYAPTRMGRMKSVTAKDRDAEFRRLKSEKGERTAKAFLKKTAIKKPARKPTSTMKPARRNPTTNGIFGSALKSVGRAIGRRKDLRKVKNDYRKEISLNSELQRVRRAKTVAERAASRAKTDRDARKFEKLAARLHSRSLKLEGTLDRVRADRKADGTETKVYQRYLYQNPEVVKLYQVFEVSKKTFGRLFRLGRTVKEAQTGVAFLTRKEATAYARKLNASAREHEKRKKSFKRNPSGNAFDQLIDRAVRLLKSNNDPALTRAELVAQGYQAQRVARAVTVAGRQFTSAPRRNPSIEKQPTKKTLANFREFQGRDATNMLKINASHMMRKGSILGRLLKIKLVGRPEMAAPAKSQLIADARKRLWISEKLGKPNRSLGQDQCSYEGDVEHVVYETIKQHLGDKTPTKYIHSLGEINDQKPQLYLDRNGYGVIRGGDYTITSAGIEN